MRVSLLFSYLCVGFFISGANCLAELEDGYSACRHPLKNFPGAVVSREVCGYGDGAAYIDINLYASKGGAAIGKMAFSLDAAGRVEFQIYAVPEGFRKQGLGRVLLDLMRSTAPISSVSGSYDFVNLESFNASLAKHAGHPMARYMAAESTHFGQWMRSNGYYASMVDIVNDAKTGTPFPEFVFEQMGEHSPYPRKDPCLNVLGPGHPVSQRRLSAPGRSLVAPTKSGAGLSRRSGRPKAGRLGKKVPIVKYVFIGAILRNLFSNAYAGDLHGTGRAACDLAPFNPYDIYDGGAASYGLGSDICRYGWNNGGNSLDWSDTWVGDLQRLGPLEPAPLDTWQPGASGWFKNPNGNREWINSDSSRRCF
jgi:hypothetical protein